MEHQAARKFQWITNKSSNAHRDENQVLNSTTAKNITNSITLENQSSDENLTFFTLQFLKILHSWLCSPENLKNKLRSKSSLLEIKKKQD